MVLFCYSVKQLLLNDTIVGVVLVVVVAVVILTGYETMRLSLSHLNDLFNVFEN